jgi:ABC-2 type transport system permease protein
VVLSYVNVLHHFKDFSRGIFDTKSVVFFLSNTVFFLFLAVKVMESRRWR